MVIEPLDVQVLGNLDIGRALLDNALKADTNYTYKLIGVDRESRVYTERESVVGREV